MPIGDPWKQPGIVKITGTRRTLLCDYDRGRPPGIIAIARVLLAIGVRGRSVRHDRTDRGWHVVIEIDRSLTNGEIVAAQLALGSDRNRETHNLRRVICGARPRDWNLLFSYKLKGIK